MADEFESWELPGSLACDDPGRKQVRLYLAQGDRARLVASGPATLDDLLALREADNLGSGQRADEGHLIELRRRIAEQQAQGFPLGLRDLAVDGNDLQRELGLPPGPLVGALLERLLDAATGDPARNTYRQAILDARAWLPEMTQRVNARSRRRGASGDRPDPRA